MRFAQRRQYIARWQLCELMVERGILAARLDIPLYLKRITALCRSMQFDNNCGQGKPVDNWPIATTNIQTKGPEQENVIMQT
jgi:hypothetical protein